MLTLAKGRAALQGITFLNNGNRILLQLGGTIYDGLFVFLFLQEIPIHLTGNY